MKRLYNIQNSTTFTGKNYNDETKLSYVGIFRCGNCESRVAAYRLLIELAKGNYAMLKDVCKQLIEMHHLPQPDCANEWEVGHVISRHVSCMSLIIQNKRFLIEKLGSSFR